MTFWRRWFLMLGALGVVAAITVLVIARDEDRLPPPDIEAAAALARAACVDLTEFERLVRANEEASRVLRLLDEAESASRRARDGDVRWVQLWSGARLLQRALTDDDASAAQLGLRVVREACAAVELPPGPSPDDSDQVPPTTVVVP